MHYSKDYRYAAADQSLAQVEAPSVGLDSQLKVLPYLVKPGQLHVRVSNLQDHFDGSITPVNFDVLAFARQVAGGKAEFTVLETTLAGSPKHHMTNWHAAEPAKPVVLAQNAIVDKIAMAEGERTYTVAMRPMEIRAFDITF